MEDAAKDERKVTVKVEAYVTRADGTVEDLGVIAEGEGEGWRASGDPA